MKIYAINGSPRKTKNTATILCSALDGAKSVQPDSIDVELIHINELPFSACVSCFECKRLDSKSYGKCVLHDPLTPILEKLSQADGVILGSPVYFGSITGKMKCCLERLLFPYCTYGEGYATIAPKRMSVAFIYTMNVDEITMNAAGYSSNFMIMESFLEVVFSKPKILYVTNTYQFDDYSKFNVQCFSESEKKKYKELQFPIDCKKAFEIGKNIAISNLKFCELTNA